MKDKSRFVPEFEDATEVGKRRREIQILLNVIEPDPKYQPMFLSDLSRIFACTRNSEDVVRGRLRSHFGSAIEFGGNETLVDVVDSLRRQIPGWPDNEV